MGSDWKAVGRRAVMLAATTGVGLSFLLVGSAGAASADVGSAGSQVGMTALCALSPAEQASVTSADLATPAAAQALCDQNGAQAGVSPLNTVSGNCGSSFIYGYNDGNGNAKISVGITVVGEIKYGSATIHFRVNSQNLFVDGNMGVDQWGEVVYHHTGVGWQTASLDAEVMTGNGIVCSSLHPTTRYYVY